MKLLARWFIKRDSPPPPDKQDKELDKDKDTVKKMETGVHQNDQRETQNCTGWLCGCISLIFALLIIGLYCYGMGLLIQILCERDENDKCKTNEGKRIITYLH